MAPSCASSVPPLIGDYPRCRAAAWQAAPTLPLGLSVAAASLSTEASLPLDMPGGREGLEGDTDAQGSARRRSGLAHTSTRRVATPRFPVSKSSLALRARESSEAKKKVRCVQSCVWRHVVCAFACSY